MQIWTASGLPSGAGCICKAQHLMDGTAVNTSSGAVPLWGTFARAAWVRLKLSLSRDFCTLPLLLFHSRFPEELVRTRQCAALPSWIECTVAQPPEMCSSGTSWAREGVFMFSSCSWTLGSVCSPRAESTLFTGVQLCQLTEQCPTGAAVLDKWHVLYFPFI